MSDDDTATDAAWQARYDQLNDYRALVGRLAADADPATATCMVFCGLCSNGRAIGRVIPCPLGPLLVTHEYPAHGDGGGQQSPSEWQRRTGRRPKPVAVGYLLAGAYTYESLFDWRPAGRDDLPAVHCPAHGPIDVTGRHDELLTVTTGRISVTVVPVG